ncbi:hypothetical protein B7R21_06315 [Subtercola boreus]|uniref:Uncharacterized protein n=1 Tax=Subtercola boreus TaxID=120213 RepID=A0A3E0VXE6_9MICO|nr:hypothetical protein [Subtercola boreus]RFA14556.1 hypothetical protein B7R21_06315 [Subtercola boreus]
MSFSEDLRAAKSAAIPYLDVEVMLNGHLHTLRFRQMDGVDWTDAVDRHPARIGVAYDSEYGYNLRTLTKYVAPKCGTLVVDGKERKLRVDVADPAKPNAKLVDEWADLFKALTGHFVGKIGDTIYNLNEYRSHVAVAKAVEQVKKALAASGKS